MGGEKIRFELEKWERRFKRTVSEQRVHFLDCRRKKRNRVQSQVLRENTGKRRR